MIAVEFVRFNLIVFSPGPIPEEVIKTIRDRFGGVIRENVCLEEPGNLNDWPPGTERPEVVLGVSRSDPNHFARFKYSRDVTGDFQPVGRRHTVISSRGGWRKFIESLGRLDDIASITDETDTPERWEEFMRGIDAHRPEGSKLFEGMY